MIKLVVSGHCHDCPCFSATTETVYNERNNKTDHYITCIESDNCRHIRLYLESQLVIEKEYGDLLRTINATYELIKKEKEE